MSVWRRLDADALIDASGVRRSCDTAWSSAVRSSLACVSSVACAAAADSRARSRARGELRRERVQHLPVGAGEPAADQREHHVVAERQREIGVLGRRRRARARPPASVCHAPSPAAREHARAVEPERRPHEHDEIGERIVLLHVGREPGERLGIGARPRRVARAGARPRRRSCSRRRRPRGTRSARARSRAPRS